LRELSAVLLITTWSVFFLVYNWKVVKRETAPSLGYWFTIAIVDWAVFFSLIGANVKGMTIAQPACWVVGATSTFLVTMWRRGQFVLDRFELVAAWLSQGDARISVIIQSLSMCIACSVIFRNALRGNESSVALLIPLIASVFSFGTVEHWTLTYWPELVIPILALALNSIGLILSLIGHRTYSNTPS
jgi:hypothetical protein